MNDFSQQISKLRQKANLTNQELSELAQVPASFISGIQTGRRKIGELQCRKVGAALGLTGQELEDFVLRGIDTCSEKVLKDFIPYPAELLNLLARQLNHAGIGPQQISHCVINDAGADIVLANGSKATLVTELIPA